MKLHQERLLYLLAGVGVTCLVMIGIGFATPQQAQRAGSYASGVEAPVTSPHHSSTHAPGHGTGAFPDPSDIVRIIEGTPYAVPADKILTLREFGATTSGSFGGVVTVNGEDVFFAQSDFGENTQLMLGITAVEGDVVTIAPEFPSGFGKQVAIGFLSDTGGPGNGN